MGENEVITDLSDIRLLICNLYDEHEVTDEAVKQLLFCIDSKMDKYRDKELITNERTKAIDDLLEDANEMAIEVDTGTYTMKAIGIGLLEQIAEQLKEGDK